MEQARSGYPTPRRYALSQSRSGAAQREAVASSPSPIWAWFAAHRPPYRRTERSWFVMLSLVCFGIAVFSSPAIFVALGVTFAVAGWWMRESARQGVLNMAFVALATGLILLAVSIVLYFTGSL